MKNRTLSSGIKAVNGVHESNESLEEQQPVAKEEKGANICRLFLVYFEACEWVPFLFKEILSHHEWLWNTIEAL